MFKFLSLHCLLFIFINNIYAESDIFSCLHLKSLCKRIPQCYKHLKHFESRCGISVHNCQTETISDCVHCLRSIRETLGVYNGTCWCYENHGAALKQCEHFRSKIWYHPCEKLLSNYPVENALLISEAELPLPLQNTLLFSEDAEDDIDVFSNSLKRTTRSPMATEIQQWRHQLDSALPAVRPQRAELTCHGALYDVCLKHIACRELWKIFRQSCIVDAQNQCKMTNPDNCWQSFEGISWTGLGNCTCVDSNSDCHWIRLQTNYNKCIYELTLSGHASKSQSVASLTYIEQYRQHHSYTTPPSTIFDNSVKSIETTPIVFKNVQDNRQLQQQQQQQNNNYYWQEEERKRLQEIERKRQEEQQKRHEEERKRYEEERNRMEKLRLERQKEIEERQRIYEEQLKKSKEQHYNNNYGRQQQYDNTNYNNNNLNQYRGYIRADIKVATTTPRTLITALTTPPLSTTPRIRTATTTSTTTTTTTTTPIPTTIATTTTTTSTTTPEESPTVTIASEEDFDENNNSVEEESTSKSSTTNAFIVSQKELNIQKNIKKEASTCKAAHKRCELNETCKWHLSEVLMRCTIDGNCIRTQCAAALRRFSRYVSPNFSEAVTFCQCATADTECKQLQHMLYPRCMYAHPGQKPKDICTDAIEMCNADSYCHRRLPKFNQSCSVTEGGVCDAKDLQACRKSLLSIRGTPLEMPCYCTENDKDCIQNQSLMLPSNPCVESAMEDYAKHHVPPQQIQEPDNDLDVEQSWKNDVSNSVEKSSTTKPSTSITSTTTTIQTTTTISSEETSTENKAQKLIEQKKLKSVKTTQKELVQDRSKSAKKHENEQIEDKIVPNPNETLDFIPTTAKPFKRKNLHTYPTDAYITHAPPPEGGCMARNIDGSWITHYKNSVIRQYYDWSGQCSSWCECTEKEELNCHELPCLPDGSCQTLQTKIAFGEKLYIDGRGACICQSGDFICDTSENLKVEELDPGLYITLGYSLQELKIFKEKVPKKYREKSGLVSPESSVVKDIVSRLQFALERVMPKEMLCRIVTLDELSHGSTVMLQLQWYGVDLYTNDTESRWHVGRMEKICSPYVQKLEYSFLLEKADRYQLILSAVKQIRVIDLLDGLPAVSASYVIMPNFYGIILFIVTYFYYKFF